MNFNISWTGKVRTTQEFDVFDTGPEAQIEMEASADHFEGSLRVKRQYSVNTTPVQNTLMVRFESLKLVDDMILALQSVRSEMMIHTDLET
jgi:hypothetical protein